MTLYQRIQAFYAIDRFRFKERVKQDIGKRVLALWKELKPGTPCPDKIKSIEDSGIYTVFDYPDSFTTFIDQIIINVHKEILANSLERKRLKEKARHPTNTPSPPSAAPLSKIRKRIPAKKIPSWKSK